MKNTKIIIIFCLFLLLGCGKEVITTTDVKTETKEVSVVCTDFSGVFRFGNTSQIELIQAEDCDVTFSSTNQILISTNPKNGTFGNHPTLSDRDLEVHNGVIFFGKNINYTTGHDLEEDVSGSNITGSRYTTFKLEIVNNKLRLTIEIYASAYNNNLNWVIARRSFNE